MSNPTKEKTEKPLIRVKKYGNSGDWLTDEVKAKLAKHDRLVEQAEKAASKADTVDAEAGSAAQVRKAAAGRDNARYDALTLQLESIDAFNELCEDVENILFDQAKAAHRDLKAGRKEAVEQLQALGLSGSVALYTVNTNLMTAFKPAFEKNAETEQRQERWNAEKSRLKRLRRDLQQERDFLRQRIG